MARKNIYIVCIAIISIAILFPACGTKKNTATSRFYQSFTTRYNVYFNGSEHYQEQLSELEKKYEDDYTNMVLIHPAEAFANPKAPQPATNFDRTIEKMQKAIQLHSIKKRPAKNSGKMKDPKYREYLKRDEYNPFIHNAWYLMGEAQYMKGDFPSSAATFHYITRHFNWMPELVMRSQLWEVRNYCALGWLTEADNIITRIKPANIKDKTTRTLYNLAFADYLIKSDKTKDAIPYLSNAIKRSQGNQKVRLNFLLGQLHAANGNNALAYEAFKKAGGSGNATYRTKFNARIKQSEVFTGKNIKNEVNSLKSMVKYDRNKDYLDQIYYAIANLYLSHKDTTNAITNYKLSAKKSTRNGIDKALSQITLGTLFFDMHNYADAQPCYAEAVPLLGETYHNYSTLKKRSDVLDELAVYSQNVKLQDSLLTLSKLTPEQQKAVAERLVSELKKKEKEEAEEAKREAYLADRKAEGNNNNNNNANAPTTYTLNNDKSWYFYNTATKNAGKTAFQKQWGSRKLEDDWRRRNKSSFSMNEFEENEKEPENTTTSTTEDSAEQPVDKATEKKLNDPHFIEYYLKQIPKTPEEIQTCNDIIQEGLYNMGIILKDKLEDYPAAISQFNILLNRYIDNIYRLDVYYNMYLMYMRSNDIAMAEKYRALITSNFSDSKYGLAMRDPNYLNNLRNMDVEQETMYQQAYDAYINNNNNEVHNSYTKIMKKYPLSKIVPKFMFIDALSYVTEKKYDKFKSTLKEMLERYPETDITPVASAILKQLSQGRKLEGGGKNVRGMIWSTRLTNDSTFNADAQLTPFEDNKDTPQLLVLVYSIDSIAPNQLLFDIAKHNFTSFVVKDFDLEQMNFAQMGLLIIKGFANFEELTHYRNVLEADKTLKLPKGVRPVMISVNNFNLLLKEGRSFEEYFNFFDDANAKKVESKALEEDNKSKETNDDKKRNK
ncbi:MAG: tetratricopeptide repeat protein [Muribaculaceae bacterium]